MKFPEQVSEGGKVKERKIMEKDEETEEVTSKKRTREEEKEENETVSAKRKVFGFCVCGASVKRKTRRVFSRRIL